MLALLAVTILAVVLLAQRYRSEERGASEYLTAAQPIAADEEVAAMGLHDTLAELSQLQRQELTRRLDLLVSSTTGSVQALEALDPPAGVGTANGFFLAAADAWQGGAKDLRDAMLSIVDDPTTVDGVDRLSGALDLLRVGDIAYDRFRDEVTGMSETLLLPTPFPTVDFIDPEAGHDPTTIAAQLGTTRQLDQKIDVTVTGSTSPEPAGTDGTTPVLPFADAVTVRIVVANVGNEAVGPLTVTMALRTATGGAPVTDEQAVSSLEPEQAATVEFPDLAVTPGTLYELTAGVDVEGDANPDDNQWKMVFVMNANQ